MNIDKNIINNQEKGLKLYILNEIIKKSKKIGGKLPPLTEIIEDKPRVLKILKAYDMGNFLKNFYLFIIKNSLKIPKERYFLAIILASQSSDLLVNLAKDFAQTHSLKLIQYPFESKFSRIKLISLKEITKSEEYHISINVLNEFRLNFLNILIKIKNLVK